MEKYKFLKALAAAKDHVRQATWLFFLYANHKATAETLQEAKKLQEQVAYTTGDFGNMGFPNVREGLAKVFNALGDIGNTTVYPTKEAYIKQAVAFGDVAAEIQEIIEVLYEVAENHEQKD